ncbi:protein phyllopod [Drosophila rhopaloa]|uniref:Protein phyllopod n=1 Tax=Drosophila rhopaloa TaxID=1041015 RepID=A0A6P4ENH5_DRORH|nr:protein phyllopod [Drosophila rhopaloa]
MSANNQQQQADPSAAVVAPAASSEYLKRTCLICGCHTNQTINIYEPRSGPNIVQLIQAKFKFQPLNEDKFLCFSCNNWLINWHSLQTVNSNEAESQSQSPSHMGNSVLQQERTKLRPVAMVRPQVRVQPQSQPQPQPQVPVNPAPAPIIYAKRRSSSRRSASVSRMSRVLRQCCLESLRRSPKKRSPQSVFVYLRQGQRRSNVICKVECVAPRRKPAVERLVKEVAPTPTPPVAAMSSSPPTYQRFPQPSVDGKVVAMFRRLGTTLSREEPPASSAESTTSTSNVSTRPPQIMSPLKQKPRWTRDLDEDEILLEFDSAISEVLPTTNVRRCLSYQVTHEDDKENGRAEEMELDGEEDEEEEEDQAEQEAEAPLEPQSHRKEDTSHQDSHQASLQLAGLRLPLGLSISLV